MLGLLIEARFSASWLQSLKMKNLWSLLHCFCVSPTNVTANSVCYSIKPPDDYLMELCHVGLITSFTTP